MKTFFDMCSDILLLLCRDCKGRVSENNKHIILSICLITTLRQVLFYLIKNRIMNISKKDMLKILQMNLDKLYDNDDFRNWYWTAVKDVAVLIWENPDDYWIN